MFSKLGHPVGLEMQKKKKKTKNCCMDNFEWKRTHIQCMNNFMRI